MRIREINTNSEKEINIKKIQKNALTNEVLFDKKKIVVESDNLKTSYTIFCLQSLNAKYNLSYDNLLILIYLQELSLFEIKITILNRRIKLDSFIFSEHIIEDYSNNNKKLYKLTDKSIRIVKEFYELLSNNSYFLSKNRQTELDLDNKVKSVLGNFFDT